MLEILLNWLSGHYTLIALILMIALLIGFIIFLVVIFRLNKLSKQYKMMMRGVENKNLEDVVLKNTKTLEQVLLKLSLMENRLDKMEKSYIKSLQKIGMVRFNAFTEVGGDLSYAIALLDQAGDGVIISSIYGRDETRTYAKPIQGGKSSYQLSSEEETAIRKAFQEEIY